jgi:hypothetical protein
MKVRLRIGKRKGRRRMDEWEQEEVFIVNLYRMVDTKRKW